MPAQHPIKKEGTELQPAVLEMQPSETSTVSVLRMGSLPAVLDRGAVQASDSEQESGSGILDHSISEKQGTISEEHTTTRNSCDVDSEFTDNADRKRGDLSMPPSLGDKAGVQWDVLPGSDAPIVESC